MSKKDKNDPSSESWSTGAKVGAAAVGSAALVAALLYANKRRKDAKPAGVKSKLRPKGGAQKKSPLGKKP